MSTELAKTYDPAAIEADVYRAWLDEKCFEADPARAGQSYCIVIPPPNVTGALHLGHAINNTLQDILTRVHRMRGFNTLWVPGVDHAGIATQAVVERTIREKEGKDRYSLAETPEKSREELIRRIWQWKEQYGDRIVSQLKRLGSSCDWSRLRFTLDETCARAVRETFFKLFKDGLIYRGKRLVNWDIHLQTSISDDELYTENVKTSLWPIRYPIDGTDQFMTVATTRPETMLADTAVAVHPDDPRWNWAVGKFVRLPLTSRLIPIIADPILVDMAFGTGCVKVTPAHDPNDYAVFDRHKGTPSEIAILNLMTPDGRVNDADPSWSAYAGLTFAQARKKVVADLVAAGLLTESDIKPHEAAVSFSDRSKTAIEPYLSDQWFVKMESLAEPALDAVRTGRVKFFPERHAQQYFSWLGEKRDWPVSRQLWWGHRIPVWSIDPGVATTAESSSEASKRLDDYQARLNQWIAKGRIVHHARSMSGFTIDERRWEYHPKEMICIRDNDPEIIKFLESWGFSQDPDVLDTWFSSALWPHSTLGWPEPTSDLAKYYPTSVLLTGRDIITLWVARMVMLGLYNMHDVPFPHVAINPTILDEFGRRMSKSAGNGVDPVDIIETHGADALRFTLATMATETQDARLPVKIICPKCQALITNPESNKVPTVACPNCKSTVTRPLGSATGAPEAPLGRMTSEKFDLGRNFCNKLWNAARFILSSIESAATASENSPSPSNNQPPTTNHLLPLPDQWILSRFTRAVAEANAALAAYRFDQCARACYTFFWDDLCDWYIESAKPAMKDPARAPQTAALLAALLDGALRLLHPLIPFITETIWARLNEVAPSRGLPGLLDCPKSHSLPADAQNAADPSPFPRLVLAPWPAPAANFPEAEHIFPRLQGIISAIRNLRNEYKVDAKKPVVVSISPPGAAALRATLDNRQLIELLANCSVKTVQENLPQPPGAARALANNDCEIFVEGLVDAGAEKQRLQKQEESLAKNIAAMNGRLANEGYIAKAPPRLVEETRQQLTQAVAELERVRADLSRLP